MSINSAENSFDDAIAAHQQALARDPGSAAAHYNLGNAYRAKGEMEEAEKCFRRVIDCDPELAVDLTAPGFDTARGKRFHGSIQLEHKDDLKARGLASPDDDDDTLAMPFAVKVAAKARPKYGPDLVYSFPEGSLSWMR